MTQPALPLVPIGHAERRRAIFASVIGNGLEWFDFGIYGVFGGILSKLFFPTSDPAALMLVATATFGIAFVVRPIGGILFGMYADRAGRKAAMSIIILLMAIGTGLIGIAPTYAMIGVAAPAIIILARVLQGLSAGGEFASATAMLIEYAPPNRRGFIGSFQMCSQALAFALGGAAGYFITHSLPPADVASWGWRIPFLLGALIGPVGHYIRSRVDESPEFVTFLRNRAQAPRLSLIAVLRQYPRQLWSSFGLVVIGTASSYVVLIYIPLSAAAQLGISSTDALLALMIGAMCLLVLCPFAGWLADRLGTRSVMLPAVVVFGLTVYPLLSDLVTAPDATALFRYEAISCCIMSFFWGPTPLAMASAFPVQVRSTGISVVYNLGVMLFGGLAPLTNAWLTKVTGDKMAPAYYLQFSVLIGATAVLMLARTGTTPAIPQARSA